MKCLYAGPWVGELGWELCSWNPSIRHIAENYDHITVEIQPGMEYLYEFADEIVINEREPDFDMYYGKPSSPPVRSPEGTKVITPQWFWANHAKTEFKAIKHADRGHLLHPKKWRKYGTEEPKHVVDVMCAWRGPKRFRGRSFPEKQYPEDRCIALTRALLDAGYSVACYGGEDNLYVEGAMDLRGTTLSELCGMLARAKLALGPSSGTIHMASLCGTPHVTWYGRPVVSMDRYLSYWNPFETPVTFLDGNCPSVEKAFASAIDRMKPETKKLNWIQNEL